MKVKKSKDGKCRFYEGKHTYYLGRKKLTSVTTLLKDFFEPFDADKIAQLKVWGAKARAKKEGREVGQEGNLTYWKKLWVESAEHGTRVHALLEQYLTKGELSVEELLTADKRDLSKYNPAKQWLIKRKTVLPGNYLSETLIYDKKLGIAGQVDLMRESEDGYEIIDFKSNDKISTEGYKGKKCLEPISHLDDCAMNKYALQLSLYAYMLERAGKKVTGLTLLHLKDGEVVEHSIAYMKKEVEDILKYRDSKI